MRFEFDVGELERIRVEFHRNPWVGTLRISANGETVVSVAPTDLSAQLEISPVKRYTFVVGKIELHQVTIEKQRPLFLGGLFPNTYRVLVDDRLIGEHRGY